MSDQALQELQQRYPPIVTTSMVAEILGLNVRTILIMVQDGRLPASRIPGSRSYRFFLADLVTMLEDNRVAGESVAGESVTGESVTGAETTRAPAPD